MKKCAYKRSIPLKEYEVMGKGPRMDGMRIATVRKESKMFNRPMAHVFYKRKEEKFNG